jgi:putative endonuclease
MKRIYLYYVYMLATNKNTALYTGVTNDLLRRCKEHREGKKFCFTSRYNIHKLVYYEVFDSVKTAIAREKQIKGYSRAKKSDLINTLNPTWTDLFNSGSIINLNTKIIKVPDL